MTSPRNRAPLDRLGRRAAGRRRITGATAWSAAGGAALAVAFGTVFAQGAAADTTGAPQPAVPPAPAAAKLAPATKPAPTTAAATPTTETPAPPAAPPAAAPAGPAPAASTGGS